MINKLKKIFKATPKNYLDDGIKQYCVHEYGKDWQFAYNCWKNDKRFPSQRQLTN
jgi:hypothetical protein|tara:strand:- start:5933 stop:6097 length:165 start_codon:yes stop_codon:yes gene_type:complete